MDIITKIRAKTRHTRSCTTKPAAVAAAAIAKAAAVAKAAALAKAAASSAAAVHSRSFA